MKGVADKGVLFIFTITTYDLQFIIHPPPKFYSINFLTIYFEKQTNMETSGTKTLTIKNEDLGLSKDLNNSSVTETNYNLVDHWTCVQMVLTE